MKKIRKIILFLILVISMFLLVSVIGNNKSLAATIGSATYNAGTNNIASPGTYHYYAGDYLEFTGRQEGIYTYSDYNFYCIQPRS